MNEFVEKVKEKANGVGGFIKNHKKAFGIGAGVLALGGLTLASVLGVKKLDETDEEGFLIDGDTSDETVDEVEEEV